MFCFWPKAHPHLFVFSSWAAPHCREPASVAEPAQIRDVASRSLWCAPPQCARSLEYDHELMKTPCRHSSTPARNQFFRLARCKTVDVPGFELMRIWTLGWSLYSRHRRSLLTPAKRQLANSCWKLRNARTQKQRKNVTLAYTLSSAILTEACSHLHTKCPFVRHSHFPRFRWLGLCRCMYHKRQEPVRQIHCHSSSQLPRRVCACPDLSIINVQQTSWTTVLFSSPQQVPARQTIVSITLPGYRDL